MMKRVQLLIDGEEVHSETVYEKMEHGDLPASRVWEILVANMCVEAVKATTGGLPIPKTRRDIQSFAGELVGLCTVRQILELMTTGTGIGLTESQQADACLRSTADALDVAVRDVVIAVRMSKDQEGTVLMKPEVCVQLDFPDAEGQTLVPVAHYRPDGLGPVRSSHDPHNFQRMRR